jgi:hypothetical protein
VATFWVPPAGAGIGSLGPAGLFPLPYAGAAGVLSGAGLTPLKTVPGLLVEAVITSEGSSGDDLVLYDSVQTPGQPGGPVLVVIPGGVYEAGTLVIINALFRTGLMAWNAAGGPAVTVGFD